MSHNNNIISHISMTWNQKYLIRFRHSQVQGKTSVHLSMLRIHKHAELFMQHREKHHLMFCSDCWKRVHDRSINSNYKSVVAQTQKQPRRLSNRQFWGTLQNSPSACSTSQPGLMTPEKNWWYWRKQGNVATVDKIISQFNSMHAAREFATQSVFGLLLLLSGTSPFRGRFFAFFVC